MNTTSGGPSLPLQFSILHANQLLNTDKYNHMKLGFSKGNKNKYELSFAQLLSFNITAPSGTFFKGYCKGLDPHLIVNMFILVTPRKTRYFVVPLI